MRRARRRDAANAAIAHAEEHPPGLIRTRRLPHLRGAKHAKPAVLISSRPDRPAQQRAIAIRFGFTVPIYRRDITLGLKAIVGTTRAPLVGEFYEIAAAAR